MDDTQTVLIDFVGCQLGTGKSAPASFAATPGSLRLAVHLELRGPNIAHMPNEVRQGVYHDYIARASAAASALPEAAALRALEESLAEALAAEERATTALAAAEQERVALEAEPPPNLGALLVGLGDRRTRLLADKAAADDGLSQVQELRARTRAALAAKLDAIASAERNAAMAAVVKRAEEEFAAFLAATRPALDRLARAEMSRTAISTLPASKLMENLGFSGKE